MPVLIKNIANSEIHKFPSEHKYHFDNYVLSDNAVPDKVIPTASRPEGEIMSSQAELHKTFIRQGPAHHYAGAGEDGGKQYKL